MVGEDISFNPKFKRYTLNQLTLDSPKPIENKYWEQINAKNDWWLVSDCTNTACAIG